MGIEERVRSERGDCTGPGERWQGHGGVRSVSCECMLDGAWTGHFLNQQTLLFGHLGGPGRHQLTQLTASSQGALAPLPGSPGAWDWAGGQHSTVHISVLSSFQVGHVGAEDQ